MLARLLGKNKKEPGWMAMTFSAEGLCLAHARPIAGEKPQVTVCGVVEIAGSNVQALRKIARDMHLDRYRCTTLLSPHEYQLVVVEAPNVPPAELKAAMRWRVKDLLDFHVDDATLDVLDIPPDPNAPTRNHSMYVVAARNTSIERRVKLFDAGKVPLEVIDIPEMAQRNIAARLEPEGRGVALLSFEEDSGLLTVTFHGELYLSRHLDIGWTQLREASTDARQGHFDRITLELQRSLDNLERQFAFISVAQLWIAPFPDAEALRAHLAVNLYVPVMLLDLNEVFDFSRVPAVGAVENQVRFFHVLGATLREETRAP